MELSSVFSVGVFFGSQSAVCRGACHVQVPALTTLRVRRLHVLWFHSSCTSDILPRATKIPYGAVPFTEYTNLAQLFIIVVCHSGP